MPKVEFGVHAGPQDISLDELRRLWRHCDGAGFDLITTWDHFYESPPRDGNGECYEALTCLAAMAVETQRSRIGCLCFGIGYRNPAVLAKSLTTIDHLSHGRVTVGLGAGWHVPEHEGYGFGLPALRDRMDRLTEGVEVLRSLLTSGRTTFEGKFFRLQDAANFPQPVQQRLPLIVGGGGEKRTTAIAAQLADGSNQAYLAPDVYRHKNEVLDHWCEVFGRDPKTLERSLVLHFHMSSKGQARQPMDGSVHGSPAQVIDQIGAAVDAGAARISIAIRPPVDWDALQSFIDDVMPAFR